MAHARRDRPLVPSFSVKLNNHPMLPDMAMWVANVVVEDEVDLPGMFALELVSKVTEKRTTAWTDEAQLGLGAPVEVSFGYGEEREPVLAGQITALEPTFSTAGPPSLIVRGFDARHRLNGTRRTRTYVAKKDSGIAEQVGSDAGVEIVATDSGVEHPYVLQADQTDLEFLRERAHRIRYELVMDDGKVRFRPVGNKNSSVVTLSLRDDLFEFRPRMSQIPLAGAQVLGWDTREKQAVVAAAGASDAASTVETFVRTTVESQPDADQLATAALDNAMFDFIRGDARARGRTDVRAGRVVTFDGLGSRFSGDYYVTSVVHRYSRREGYLTDFRVQRAAS